MNLNSKF